MYAVLLCSSKRSDINSAASGSYKGSARAKLPISWKTVVTFYNQSLLNKQWIEH